LSYALLRRIAEARPTVYFESNDDHGYYKFTESGVTFIQLAEDDPMASDQDVWILADNTPPSPFWTGTRDWLIIDASSPGVQNYKNWTKQAIASTLYMDTWSWAEIVFLRLVERKPNDNGRKTVLTRLVLLVKERSRRT
jgi:Zn-dependent M28 family amino/carboxypeptidase